MSDYFESRRVISMGLLFMLFCGHAFAETDGEIIRDVTIQAIVEKGDYGKLVDVEYPSRLLNCFVFIFKKGKTVYRVAANSAEPVELKPVDEHDLREFLTIGYVGTSSADGKDDPMFKIPDAEPPFPALSLASARLYTSVSEIESETGLRFELAETGGFHFPFNSWTAPYSGGYLYIVTSPEEEKGHAYYMGLWKKIRRANP